MTTVDSDALLKAVPLFSDLSPSELAEVASLCSRLTVRRGTVIVAEEEQGSTFFLIVRGQVKVTHIAPDGREVVLAILRDGDFFGEMALLDGKARSASVVALEDTDLLTLRRPDFLALLNRRPGIAVSLLRELAARIRACDQQISTLTLQDALGRVAATLVRLAERTGRSLGPTVVIPRLPLQRDLANMAGTARETASRALKYLESKGDIKRVGRRLFIHNYHAFLQKYARQQ
ncbi:MAG: Crp/Fnr family transcriptional regulator [candidate division KSB1 bacterium]|nr:Crp/Fnr family transcriptional regulator [candidate division KSB1 bacterium]